VDAVKVRDSEMRYFDSRDEPLTIDHVMASGALPPAFPAVRIGAEAYWDGGVYSNTPIEAGRRRQTAARFSHFRG
jgi:NTE family protein